MSKKIVELSTKRKVEIKEMSIDDIDYCNDLLSMIQEDNGSTALRGLNKSRTAWLRRGVSGGDFKAKVEGGMSDEALKELSATEKNELNILIQDFQRLGE